MPSMNAAERVRQRLNEWAKTRGHGAVTALGKAVTGKYGKPMTPQWASGVLSGKSELRLEDLDAVANLLGVLPGDLVRRDGDHYLEVIPSEMQILKHVRALPDTIRQHWLMYLNYVFGFRDELVKERQGQIDKRTKAARLQQQHERGSDHSDDRTRAAR